MTPHRVTAESILGPNLQALIDAAEPDPTPEQLEATAAERQIEAIQATRKRVLCPECGWTAKALHDVQNVPLRGEKWHRAFRDALAAIRAGGIVILCGGRGPGKTRMAAEIAVELGTGTYRKAMQFFLDVQATMTPRSSRDKSEVIEELTQPRFLALDEMQVRSGSKFENDLLTHAVDERYAAMKPTMMIANLTHDQLADCLGASILDRVHERGEIIHCNWPSFRGT